MAANEKWVRDAPGEGGAHRMSRSLQADFGDREMRARTSAQDVADRGPPSYGCRMPEREVDAASERLTLRSLGELLKERNAVDIRIASLLGRPAERGHIGEFIASRVFDVELEESASTKGRDGHFRSGPLAGSSVNVKLYGRQEGLLDVSPRDAVDFYLVLTGPRSTATSTQRTARTLVIDAVYLFSSGVLHDDLLQRGVRVGIASSVRQEAWRAAEIYPEPTNPMLPVTDGQRTLLALFSSSNLASCDGLADE